VSRWISNVWMRFGTILSWTFYEKTPTHFCTEPPILLYPYLSRPWNMMSLPRCSLSSKSSAGSCGVGSCGMVYGAARRQRRPTFLVHLQFYNSSLAPNE
jgi:hypothetical protein